MDKPARLSLLVAVTILLVTIVPAHAATFTVNSTGDLPDESAVDGLCNTGNTVGPNPECTLRAAIDESNRDPDVDIIVFNIPVTDPGRDAVTGVFTIRPATVLPRINGDVSINADTQPGASLSASSPTVPGEHLLLIELDGSQAAGTDLRAFEPQIQALGGTGNITIRGFVINGWVAGVRANFTSNNVIRDNFFGTDSSGLVAKGRAQSAVVIGNVANTEVTGNLVAGGAVPGPNVPTGVTAGAPGVLGGSGHNIRNNYIGIDATGNAALGVVFSHGVRVMNATNVTVGGSNPVFGNVIGGAVDGVEVRDSTGTIISANRIGVGADGASSVANTGYGVEFFDNFGGLDTSGNQIGGLDPLNGNVIANNQAGGVLITAAEAALNNPILSNSIFDSGFSGTGRGIQLGANARDQDVGDSDTGPNNAQNYPEILNVSPAQGGQQLISARLDSTPISDYTIQYFASAACGVNGYGPGQTLLGTQTNVSTDPNGEAQFGIPVTFPPGQNILTATATDAAGNTSEFSDCFDVGISQSTPGVVGLSDTAYSVQEGDFTPMGPGRLVSVTRENGTDGRIQISYSTDDTPGGAIGGFDFTPTAGDLIFEDGETNKTFYVPIIDDPDLEDSEPFDVFLSDPLDVTIPGNPVPDPGLLDPDRTTATVTIIDNEVSFSVLDSVLPDDDGVLPFLPTLPNDTATETVTVVNESSFDLFVNQVSVVDLSQPFSIGANTCFVIDAGGTCTFEVLFQPPATEQYQTTIRVTVENQDFDLTVSGTSSTDIDLVLTMAVNTLAANAGDTLIYTVTATNRGPADATGVEVIDQLPAGLTFVSASADPAASYDPVTGAWSVGNLSGSGPGRRAVLTLETMVDADVNEQSIVNQAQISASQPVDPDPSDNTASAVVGIGGADVLVSYNNPDRSTVSAKPGAFNEDILVGELVVFLIGITNNGPQAVSNIRVEFREPVYMRFSNSDASCEEVSNFNYSCDISGLPGGDVLDPGETVEFAIRATPTSFPGRFTSLTVEVKTPGFDPNLQNNQLTSAGVFILIPFEATSDGGLFCFIATAAYGTPWKPNVVTLRRFRDEYLLTNTPGRAFVDLYYRTSPPIAAWIRQREWARANVRTVLTPVVFAIERPGNAFTVVLGCTFLPFLLRRRSRIR